ncbi:hypothetical protein D3C71_1017590 [compost metagenome]
MRVFHHVQRRQAHGLEQFTHALLELSLVGDEAMLLERLANDVFDQPAGVQAGIRVLEDHLDAAAHGLGVVALEGGVRILVVKREAAACGLVQTHQQARHGAFAAAGLTHQGQGLAFFDLETHAVHRMQQRAGLALDHAVEPGGGHVKSLGQVVRLHQSLAFHCCAHAVTSVFVVAPACSQQAARVEPASIRSGRSVMQRSKVWGQRGL